MSKINRRHCYLIIENLLDHYYFNSGEQRDIAVLVDSMMLADNEDISFDQAMWEDWLKIIKNKQKLTLPEGYEATLSFLDFYANLMSSKQIKTFANQLTFKKWQAAAKEGLDKINDKEVN